MGNCFFVLLFIHEIYKHSLTRHGLSSVFSNVYIVSGVLGLGFGQQPEW